MRKLCGALCLFLVLSGALAASLPALLYAASPRLYAAHCVNSDRPALHCNGKCQRMRQIRSALGVHGPALHEPPPAPPETHWFHEPFVPVPGRPGGPARRTDSPVRAASVFAEPQTPPPKAT